MYMEYRIFDPNYTIVILLIDYYVRVYSQKCLLGYSQAEEHGLME